MCKGGIGGVTALTLALVAGVIGFLIGVFGVDFKPVFNNYIDNPTTVNVPEREVNIENNVHNKQPYVRVTVPVKTSNYLFNRNINRNSNSRTLELKKASNCGSHGCLR